MNGEKVKIDAKEDEQRTGRPQLEKGRMRLASETSVECSPQRLTGWRTVAGDGDGQRQRKDIINNTVRGSARHGPLWRANR